MLHLRSLMSNGAVAHLVERVLSIPLLDEAPCSTRGSSSGFFPIFCFIFQRSVAVNQIRCLTVIKGVKPQYAKSPERTLITSGPLYKLHEAWWGKAITTRTIPISDDIDANDVSTQPPLGVSPQSIVDGWHTIVNIDYGVTARPLGEMLLRREFVTTLQVVKSHTSGFPESSVGSPA